MKFFDTEVNFLLSINDQWEPKKQLRHHLACKTQSPPPPLLHEKETKTKPGHLDRFSYEIAKLALQKETEILQIQRMDIQLAKLKSQGDNAKCFCNTTSQIKKNLQWDFGLLNRHWILKSGSRYLLHSEVSQIISSIVSDWIFNVICCHLKELRLCFLWYSQDSTNGQRSVLFTTKGWEKSNWALQLLTP